MSGSTKRTALIAIVLIVLSVAVFGIVLHQVVTQGQKLNDQIATLEAQNAQEASYYQLQRLAGETTAERTELLGHFLQRESDSIDFLNQVESIAPDAGVSLKTNSLDTITNKDAETWIEATFSFSGTWENVQNFVQVLEVLPYMQRLTKIDLKARSANNWQADVTMQVRVLTYDE